MGILDDIKETVSIIQKIDNIDLYRKILDLQAEAMALVEENRTLKAAASIEAELEYRQQAYWKKYGTEKQEGPFCPKCWDVERKLVRLLKSNGFFPQCPSCKIFVEMRS